MSFSSEWFRNLPKEEQKNFEELVRSSTAVLSRLRELIDDKVVSLATKEADLTTYDAGYPYWQAHVNGRKAGLLEVRRLLEFLDQEKRKEK